MAFFRPVQAVGRPTSYTIASGETLYRGQIVFLQPDGTLTITGTSGNVIAGICDDNHASSIDEKKIQVYTISALTAVGSAVTTSITTGYTMQAASADVYVNENLNKSGWLVEYKLSTASSWTKAATANTVVAVATNGVITVTASSLVGGATAVYDLRVTAVMDVIKNGTGYVSASDQFNNDSAAASGLATVWFMPGQYESDMYDNTVSYGVGDPLYVTTAGILTTAGSGVVQKSDPANIQIGYVIGAPSASLTAQTRVVSGHANPNPQAVRFVFNLPVDPIV